MKGKWRLQTMRSPHTNMRKGRGLIGTVKGASRDLSTNPEHFDGFGGS